MSRGHFGLSALLGAETGPRPRRASPRTGSPAGGSKAPPTNVSASTGAAAPSTCSPTAMNTSSSDVAVTETSTRPKAAGRRLQPLEESCDACPGCVDGVRRRDVARGVLEEGASASAQFRGRRRSSRPGSRSGEGS